MVAVGIRRLAILALAATSASWCLRASAEPALRAPSVDALVRLYVRAQRTVNVQGVVNFIVMSPNGPARNFTNRVARDSDGRCLSVCIGPPRESGSATAEDGTWVSVYDRAANKVTRNRCLPGARDAKAVASVAQLIQRN